MCPDGKRYWCMTFINWMWGVYRGLGLTRFPHFQAEKFPWLFQYFFQFPIFFQCFIKWIYQIKNLLNKYTSNKISREKIKNCVNIPNFSSILCIILEAKAKTEVVAEDSNLTRVTIAKVANDRVNVGTVSGTKTSLHRLVWLSWYLYCCAGNIQVKAKHNGGTL